MLDTSSTRNATYLWRSLDPEFVTALCGLPLDWDERRTQTHWSRGGSRPGVRSATQGPVCGARRGWTEWHMQIQTWAHFQDSPAHGRGLLRGSQPWARFQRCVVAHRGLGDSTPTKARLNLLLADGIEGGAVSDEGDARPSPTRGRRLRRFLRPPSRCSRSMWDKGTASKRRGGSS